jgi:hypothetical protein
MKAGEDTQWKRTFEAFILWELFEVAEYVIFPYLLLQL